MPRENTETAGSADEKKPLELTAQTRTAEPGKKEVLLRFALAIMQSGQAEYAYLNVTQTLDRAEELAAEYAKRTVKIKE